VTSSDYKYLANLAVGAVGDFKKARQYLERWEELSLAGAASEQIKSQLRSHRSAWPFDINPLGDRAVGERVLELRQQEQAPPAER